MLKFKSLPLLAGAAALGIVLGATPVSATVFFVNSNNIGVPCTPKCGTIRVTDNRSGKYTFDVDLSSALVIHNVQSGGTRAVGFDLTGVTAIDSGPVTALASSVIFDGFGTYNFPVRCSAVTAGNICNPNG